MDNFFMISVLLSILFFSPTLFADDFYTAHAVGWHWYQDPVEEKKVYPKNEKSAENINPDEVVQNAKVNLQRALNAVIVNPTEENVVHYLKLQEALTGRAQKVADVWQATLLDHPELNYGLQHPTNALGIAVDQEETSRKKDLALHFFGEHSGLFFFYKSTCPYCKRFAPILKSFAERNGLTVIPITLDGMPLPEFPDSKVDQGQAATFHVTVTPSLFAVNPYTKKAYPIAYGLTSETELRDNIYKIMQREYGKEAIT